MLSFVPLGISAYNGKEEKGNIKFTIDIEDNNADKLLIQVRNGSNVIYEEEITEGPMLKVGSHPWYWDGFDSNGVLDTKMLTDATNLNLLSKVWLDDETEFETVDFKASYDEVKWVDVKIDKKTKRIDITLRVNLTDGGTFGIDCTNVAGSIKEGIPPRTICPWDKIPKKAISSINPIIKKRTRSFEELKQMVLEGINTYWSRRFSKTKGTIINNGNWEIIVIAVNTDNSDISLNDIPLIYNTNNSWSRSGNPGDSHFGDGNVMDELAKLLPDGIVQRISYNDGYIKYSNGWFFNQSNDEDEEFKETSAHEIGHEILQAYGGNVYSWQHKGSSYYMPQDKKPIEKESFKEEYINMDYMEDTKGEIYPKNNEEIDLMKYYHGRKPSDFHIRCVANAKDVVGLLWLAKLNLQ